MDIHRTLRTSLFTVMAFISAPSCSQPVHSKLASSRLEAYQVDGGFDVLPLRTDETKTWFSASKLSVNALSENYYLIGIELVALDSSLTRKDVTKAVAALEGTSIAITTFRDGKSSRVYKQQMIGADDPIIASLGRHGGVDSFAWISKDLSLCNRILLSGRIELNVSFAAARGFFADPLLNKLILKPVLLGPRGKSASIFGDARAKWFEADLAKCS